MGFRQTSVFILSYFEVLFNIIADYNRIGNFGTFQIDGRDTEIDLNVVVTQFLRNCPSTWLLLVDKITHNRSKTLVKFW